jgi:hypothetical protein
VSAPIAGLRRPIAALAWLLAVGTPVAIASLVVASPMPEQDAWAIPLYSLIVASWGLAGAFLVTRRPENRVGWVLLAVGLGIGTALVAQLWAELSLGVHGGSLPGTTLASILGLIFFPSLYLVMLVPLLFPDGRVMSRRWGAVAALLLVAAAMSFIGSLVRPGDLENMPGVANPAGVAGLRDAGQALIDLSGILSLLCLPAGIVAAILRYRRGTLVERKQLKWFGSVLVLAFSAFFGATILPQPYGQWAWIVASLCMGLIPIAIGIAILRYRLYEIDRIVSRTIGWALVTGVLLAVFAGTIVGLQALLAPFTNNNTLAVAGSTLLAAALFQPLRARVQRAVDRRFNRARVDAQRAIDVFGAHLRDDVDLGALHGRLLAAADATVQPSGASLWIRRTGP